MITGFATPEGTARYADRQAEAGKGHFKESQGLTFSSIGVGTYLGEPTPEYDVGYRDSIVEAVQLGCNVIDSAINYRFQRSERSAGDAIRQLVQLGIPRDELIICTKGGFLSFDGDYPRNPAAWVEDTFLKPGIINRDDIVGGSHCMAPAYLRHQIEQSLQNMGLSSIDVYYAHNPESQLGHCSEDDFYSRLQESFAALELEIVAGRIHYYGTATWNGYRVGPNDTGHLSVEKVVAAARAAGGENHHMRFIQAPVNLAMPEAFGKRTQLLNGTPVSLVEAASALGLTVIASGSMLQARLAHGLPSRLAEQIVGASSDAQKAIQFTRSVPGITTALVGMSNPDHVRHNLELVASNLLTSTQFNKLGS